MEIKKYTIQEWRETHPNENTEDFKFILLLPVEKFVKIAMYHKKNSKVSSLIK